MKPIALALILAVSPALGSGSLAAHQDKDKEKDKGKPSISVKASPTVAFSPARIVLTADIKGGPNDYEAFYCPSIEWQWGDGTSSNQTSDCDPYEPGKSEIKRHFTIDRVFQTSGDFRVEFRIKRKDKVIAIGSTMVKIRPGVREIGGE
jgi:hypothetical protein